MTNGLKLILMSVGTIITCIVVTVAIHMSAVSQRTQQSFTEQLNHLQTELEVSSITMFDGIEVYGADVINFIKQQMGKYQNEEVAPLIIHVVTSLQPWNEVVCCNNTLIDSIQNFSDSRYIKPTNKFVGQVIYNENDVITEVRFTIKNDV